MRNRAPFSPSEIRQALFPEEAIGPQRPAAGVSTDSREIAAGQLFVALQGPRFDGHDFVKQALASGAAGVVVERWPLPGVPEQPDLSVWKVKDSLEALGALGQWHRKRFSIPLAALTGSCGKSTTKNMLAHLLLHGRPSLATPGTQNNRIGVPMTLLRMDSTHASAVLELGANQWGEIRTLTELCQPTVGVVTNIGPAHLQVFGDLSGVLREKGALWENMRPEAPIVLNADDPLLWEAGRKLARRVVWFGTAPAANVRAAEIESDEQGSRCRINGRWELRIPLPGSHNVLNALAALACAEILGESLEAAVARLSDIPVLPGRMFPREREGVLILDDSYNANPASLQAAVEVLAHCRCSGRKVFVVGDMLELGERAESFHLEAGRRIRRVGVDLLIGVGPLSRRLVSSAVEAGQPADSVRSFDRPEEAGAFLWEWVRRGDVVLVKGSRGMRMERVIELLKCSTTSSIR